MVDCCLKFNNFGGYMPFLLIMLGFITVTITFAMPFSDRQIAGETLYLQDCSACHIQRFSSSEALYQRPERISTSLSKLKNMVQACEVHFGLQYFEEDVLAVTDYLNTKYLQFSDNEGILGEL
jgi:mono/diheme cytochrome c family protein